MPIPFIEQTTRELGGHLATIELIEVGIIRPHRDGIDITEEVLADARHRVALARRILAPHS
jgi:hypothetical protein